MKKKIFDSVMRELWGEAISLTDAWDTYTETQTTLDIGRQIDIMMLEALPKMSRQKRLEWREALAEQGVEMTPTQVDQYISIIELALGV